MCAADARARAYHRLALRPLSSSPPLFRLAHEQKHPRNLLNDPAAELGDLEFANSSADAERVVFYDFEPRVDDCPLLLRAPRDFKIEAMHKAEEVAKREKDARFNARRGPSSGASPGGFPE